MEMTKEEFDHTFRETLDMYIEGLAENPDVDVRKFYGMACFLENMAFFSPVLYGLLQKREK